MIIEQNQSASENSDPSALPHVKIIWSKLDAPTVTIDCVVVIPTFKRPEHLERTLRSVLAQKTMRSFAVVVMDNHPEGAEGAARASQIMKTQTAPGIVLLALRRGNCAAYNAGFRTALHHFPTASHILIIDDDEIAPPHWMETLLNRAAATGADCVGAPQDPIFEAGSDIDMAAHPVFQPPYMQSGSVPILYSSGNVAIATDLLRDHGDPWLDEGFNFLGGGDSDFYDRSKAKGATFAWEAEAAVAETTPARRTELSWLNSRSLRNGSISALIQKRAASSSADHAKRVIKSLLLLAASPYRCALTLVKTGSPARSLNAMHVALGRLLMEIGFANEQYRAAEKN
ncbi:MAG: glycosyltransferase [Pseudomonadota bacterium]